MGNKRATKLNKEAKKLNKNSTKTQQSSTKGKQRQQISRVLLAFVLYPTLNELSG
jgi:hypothetical protein